MLTDDSKALVPIVEDSNQQLTIVREFLAHYGDAEQEIATMKASLCKDAWNSMEAIRALGQAAQDYSMQNQATVLKMRLEYRLGEELHRMKENGQLSKGQPNESNVLGQRQYLKDLGLTSRS